MTSACHAASDPRRMTRPIRTTPSMASMLPNEYVPQQVRAAASGIISARREDLHSMMRSWLVVPAAGLVSLMLTYGAIAFGRQSIAGPIGEANRQRAWFTTRGFYPPEADIPAARSFSWTQDHAELRVAAIDRARPYRITFRILAGRGPATPPPPDIGLSFDGVERSREPGSNDRRDYTVVAPPATGTTLTIGLDLSNTFV